jgi:hypothetical protein
MSVTSKGSVTVPAQEFTGEEAEQLRRYAAAYYSGNLEKMARDVLAAVAASEERPRTIPVSPAE